MVLGQGALVMVNDELIKQLKFEEGLRLHAYFCTAGKKTIGYGHNLEARPTLEGNKIPDTISENIADVLLHLDVTDTIDLLKRAWLEFDTLRGARQDACVNIAYQLGVAKFMGFQKMRAHLIKSEWQGAYDEALNSYWAKQTPDRAKRVAGQFVSGEYYKVKI